MLQLGKMYFFLLCVTKTWMTWVYIPEQTLSVPNLKKKNLDVYHHVYLTCSQIRTFVDCQNITNHHQQMKKRLKSGMMEKGCQFHMGNFNVIPMRPHLHVQSQN